MVAFDRVWHRCLFAKMYHHGFFFGNLHKWFDSYLSNRFQRLTIPSGCSEWVEIKADVPKGSILGLFLFLLYINGIDSNIKLLADDTTICFIVDFPYSAEQILNIDLEQIAN